MRWFFTQTKTVDVHMKATIVYRKSSLLISKTQVRFALFILKKYLMEYQYVIED
jgi:hypothetical protein